MYTIHFTVPMQAKDTDHLNLLAKHIRSGDVYCNATNKLVATITRGILAWL